MKIETRIAIEKRIVRRIITDAIAAGYTVDFHNGEETVVKESASVGAIMAEIMQCDEERLIIRKNGARFGSVFLVYGNDGYDVVNDHSISLNDLMKGASELADQLETRHS